MPRLEFRRQAPCATCAGIRRTGSPLVLMLLTVAVAVMLSGAFHGCTFAGRAPAPRSISLRALRPSSQVARAAADNFIALGAVEPAVSAYVNIWTPYFKAAQESGLAPEAVLHWGHAAAMGTVLIAMGGYGTFLGWQTRFGNGDAVYPLNLGIENRRMHSLLMGAALFFFFLGGQGGLVLLATAGKPILQSAHSSTAVVGLGLMATQAAIGLNMGSSELGRTIHAILGTSTMLILFVHLFFGLNLGYTF